MRISCVDYPVTGKLSLVSIDEGGHVLLISGSFPTAQQCLQARCAEFA
jgi:hypothetical protein